MVLRRIIGVVGALIILVGGMEIVFPVFTIALTRSLAHVPYLRIAGAVGVVMGAILVVAYARKLVGLRLFVVILGTYMIIAGLVTLAGPELVRDLIHALLLRRGPGFQMMILWVSGLIRIALGCALLYAVIKPPQFEPQQN